MVEVPRRWIMTTDTGQKVWNDIERRSPAEADDARAAPPAWEVTADVVRRSRHPRSLGP
jgi:hypothetical protein